ncbi:hypothetical protein R6242_21355 [Iodobacter sp. CM08]|uniref:hypothetical protein n=1 Tax=Iodobacter sp. CM08 TaxID=3085902 RepID=UPI0029813412|nr:hypothetical protein [Iodobacter sp. CM08]MDW5419124.1 hypothetical protein [Iodobacter sp. CM08]
MQSAYNVYRLYKSATQFYSDPSVWKTHGPGQLKIHFGLDLTNGGTTADSLYVGEDNNKVVFAGWMGSSSGGLGSRVAIKRPNGDVYTYNHMNTIAPALQKAFDIGTSDSGKQGGRNHEVPANTGYLVGTEGTTGKVAGQYAKHLHINYIRSQAANQAASENWKVYSGSMATYTANAKVNFPGGEPPIGVSGLIMNKSQAAAFNTLQQNVSDDPRRYFCNIPLPAQGADSVDPRLTAAEAKQFPARRDASYFKVGRATSAEAVAKNTEGLSEEKAKTAQDLGKQADAAGSQPTSGAVSPQTETSVYSTPGVELDKASRQVGLFGNDPIYGTPPMPPYNDYAGASEQVMLMTESSRRNGDTNYWIQLLNAHPRAIWIEIARIQGMKNYLMSKNYQTRQNIELMLSLMNTSRAAKQFTPAIHVAYSKANQANAANKVR